MSTPHIADDVHLPFRRYRQVRVHRSGHVFMAHIHRPRLELFGRLTKFAAQMGQGLAETMWRILRQLDSRKGSTNYQIYLGSIGKAVPCQSQIGKSLALYHTHPSLGKQCIFRPEQFDFAQISDPRRKTLVIGLIDRIKLSVDRLGPLRFYLARILKHMAHLHIHMTKLKRCHRPDARACHHEKGE